jgi:hypothetical protein
MLELACSPDGRLTFRRHPNAFQERQEFRMVRGDDRQQDWRKAESTAKVKEVKIGQNVDAGRGAGSAATMSLLVEIAREQVDDQLR